MREGKPGTALLVYGNLPPARLRLRPWFSDRTLRQQVKTAAGRSGLVRARLVDAWRAFRSPGPSHEEDPQQGGQEDAALGQHDPEAAQNQGDAKRPLGGAQDASQGGRGNRAVSN